MLQNDEIFKFIEKKDFASLEKIIDNDETKAKYIFKLLKEYNLFNLFYENQIKPVSKKKLLIQIKENIIDFVNANFTIEILNLAGERRGNNDDTIEKIETSLFNITPVSDKLLLSFTNYYNKLIIKKDNELLMESEKYQEKEFELDCGNFVITIDDEDFEIKIAG